MSPAAGGFSEEATTAIVFQIAGQISAKFAEFLGWDGQQLLNTLPSIVGNVGSFKGWVDALTEQVNTRIPDVTALVE